MKNFDRFDFEQQIMNCWNVTSDIKTVYEYLLDAPLEVGREDKIANMLLGIEALYEAKFDKLFRQFETLVHENSAHLDRDHLSNIDGIDKDLGTQTGMDSTTDPAYGAGYAAHLDRDLDDLDLAEIRDAIRDHFGITKPWTDEQLKRIYERMVESAVNLQEHVEAIDEKNRQQEIKL